MKQYVIRNAAGLFFEEKTKTFGPFAKATKFVTVKPEWIEGDGTTWILDSGEQLCEVTGYVLAWCSSRCDGKRDDNVGYPYMPAPGSNSSRVKGPVRTPDCQSDLPSLVGMIGI